MSALVWFAFYPGDYLRDTGQLSLLEHGAYLVLLMNYYSTGTLPSDPELLHRIARAFSEDERRAVARVVSQFFTLHGDRLHHKRADREIEKRQEKCTKNAQLGRLGGIKSAQYRRASDNSDCRTERSSERSSKTTTTTTEKETTSSSGADAPGRGIAESILALLREIKPDLQQPSLSAWAKDCDKMVRLDGRTPDKIIAVTRWATHDPFWQAQILSPAKLREKFDQLELKMKCGPTHQDSPSAQREKYAGLEG